MTHIRLLLVDDHILFRESLRRLLASEPDFEVVADCGTADEALAVLRKEPVDVILLDFDLGGTFPTRCLGMLHDSGYAGKILMVTAGMTADESAMALRNGASGVFLKSDSPNMLTQAIRLVANGSTWFDRNLLQRMSESRDSAGRPEDDSLTYRQRQVLEGVFEGLANKEIGMRLGLSESAVKTTLQQLFHKTGVRTRSQLVRIALERSFMRTQGSSQDHDRVLAGA